MRFPNEKLTFGPKYPNFRVKIVHVRPNWPIGASLVNVFNTKEVSQLVPWCEGARGFTLSPQKMDFWPKHVIFGPFGLMPNQKTMQKRCCGAFPLCWYQNFWFLSQKLEFWPKNGPILPKTWILVKYWSLGSIWFQARPIKQCKRGAQGTLSWEKTVVF